MNWSNTSCLSKASKKPIPSQLNSILRDTIKGQITAVECGIVSFEAVFMPYMLTADGRLVIERLAEMNLLPSPETAKVVPLK